VILFQFNLTKRKLEVLNSDVKRKKKDINADENFIATLKLDFSLSLLL